MKPMLNFIATVMLLFATSCTKDNESVTPSSTTLGDITVTVGGRSFEAALEQNSTAEAFLAMLPLTLEMSELNGNEKYHYLDHSLPTNSVRPGTIYEGDLMLYGDNCLVLFYETFSSSYSYSRIGRITDPSGLKETLGSGNVTITFDRK
jgi:hypothetical protein